MFEQKEKKVFAELMQYGYDRNVIALTDMKGNPELEAQFEDLTRTVIKANWDWFNSTDKEFEEETKRRSVMRFCFTVGIGAAWFWENKKEEITAKGLYGCMEQPRSAFQMDEYIEDVTGIWWSSRSIDHNKGLRVLSDCVDILKQYYDLDDKEQEQKAGHLLMLFGMYYGYTRIYHERAIEPYKSDMPWHWEVWEVLYGKGEGEPLDEYNEWASKAVANGKMGLGNDVILDNPESEFGKVNHYYRQFTLNEDAGIRTLAYIENMKLNLLTASPIFDTSRSYHLILDNVYVWENGAEATIEAHFSDDKDCHITFYDTNYLENKDKYYAGVGYMFDLYGIAYHAEIVPEDQRSFTFEGEKAINFKKKLGEEPEYDENGNPEPIVFQAANMHSFMQINDKIPEDATFRAPIMRVYDDVDFLGKKVYEVEIGISYRDIDKGDKRHPISVYIASDSESKLSQRPVEDEPIHGVLYLQGKMRCMTNWQETPSTMLHTFEAKKKDGSPSIFTHVCDESEKGMPMNEQEIQDFAKEVYFQQLSERLGIKKIDSEDEDMPDFNAGRKRDVWVKADVNYTADTDFIAEKKDKYLIRSYVNHRIPVIAYISLYDVNGNTCKWQKGGEYKAKIHYGSVLPGQKMEVMHHKSHDELVEKLYDSLKNLDTYELSRYLHKDLDFRSANLADPIITREEYLARTESVNNANRKAADGPVKPVLCHDDVKGAYIEMNYPKGAIDIIKVETNGGFITAIRIENIKE